MERIKPQQHKLQNIYLFSTPNSYILFLTGPMLSLAMQHRKERIKKRQSSYEKNLPKIQVIVVKNFSGKTKFCQKLSDLFPVLAGQPVEYYHLRESCQLLCQEKEFFNQLSQDLWKLQKKFLICSK